MEAAEVRDDQAQADGRDARRRGRVLALSAAAFAIVLWGGYSRHWSWTGINGSTATLWDWLHLLALPVAAATLPLWLSPKMRVTKRHTRVGLAALGVFALLVVVGYAVPWAWTGFTGNTLWDWLELLALPVAVALAPVYRELRAVWSPRHSFIAAVALVTFSVVVLGGYLAHWSWTGFEGNTLWNWLQLLLLPLLLPAVVVPALMPMIKRGVTEHSVAAPEPPPAEASDHDREPAPSADVARR